MLHIRSNVMNNFKSPLIGFCQLYCQLYVEILRRSINLYSFRIEKSDVNENLRGNLSATISSSKHGSLLETTRKLRTSIVLSFSWDWNLKVFE